MNKILIKDEQIGTLLWAHSTCQQSSQNYMFGSSKKKKNLYVWFFILFFVIL
jgi:hypothetical protein